ncbi:MAG: ComEC/Rec2 family competence protein [Phycisphaerales bacterium]
MPGAAPSEAMRPARRAVAAFGCVAIGLLLGRETAPALWLTLTLGATAACAALALRDRPRAGALCAACALLAASWWTVRIEMRASDDLARALPPGESRLVRLEGVALEAPAARERPGRFARWAFGSPSQRFRMRASRAAGVGGWAAASGVVYVRASGGAPPVRAGDRVRVTGMARAPDGARNPGGFAGDLWARQAGVAAFVQTDSALVEVIRRDGGGLRRLRDGVRARALATIDRAAPPVRPLLAATLLGETTDDLEQLRRAFTRLGVAHLLAVSGLHLAALAGLALGLARLPHWGWRVRALVALAVTIGYLALVPAKAPIVRAGVMTAFLVAGEAAGRRHDRLTTLAWAAIVVLAWRPLELWSAGFQLSFGVVAALVTLTGPLRDRLLGPAPEAPEESLGAWVRRRAADVGAGAIVAWAVATPLVAAHFGVVSPLGVVAGLALAPVFACTLAAGFVAIALGVVGAPGADAALGATEALAHVQLWLVGVFDGAPGATLRTPPMAPLLGLLASACIAWWLSGRTARPRLRVAATALVLIGCAHALARASRQGLDRAVTLRLDTFAVGDGACHLVRTPGGALLWDAGGSDLAAGEREIPQAVRALGAWRVPDVVITHPNLDHYAFLPDLIEPLGVRRVHLGDATLREAARAGTPEASLVADLRAAGVSVREVHAGSTLSIGDAVLAVLSPPVEAPFEGPNDWSLVGLVTVGDARLLLTGDIQDEAIGALRTARPEIRAQAIEVPHHGSAREAGIGFVGDSGALVAVQSTGPARLGDARWAPERSRRAWLVTAAAGSVAVEWRRDGTLRWGPTARASGWTVASLRPAGAGGLVDEAEATDVGDGDVAEVGVGRGEVDEEGPSHHEVAVDDADRVVERVGDPGVDALPCAPVAARGAVVTEHEELLWVERDGVFERGGAAVVPGVAGGLVVEVAIKPDAMERDRGAADEPADLGAPVDVGIGEVGAGERAACDGVAEAVEGAPVVGRFEDAPAVDKEREALIDVPELDVGDAPCGQDHTVGRGERAPCRLGGV